MARPLVPNKHDRLKENYVYREHTKCGAKANRGSLAAYFLGYFVILVWNEMNGVLGDFCAYTVQLIRDVRVATSRVYARHTLFRPFWMAGLAGARHRYDIGTT